MSDELEWKFRVKYSPDQPRVPAGSSSGGQWTSGGGSGIRVVGEQRLLEGKEDWLPEGLDKNGIEWGGPYTGQFGSYGQVGHMVTPPRGYMSVEFTIEQSGMTKKFDTLVRTRARYAPTTGMNRPVAYGKDSLQEAYNSIIEYADKLRKAGPP